MATYIIKINIFNLGNIITILPLRSKKLEYNFHYNYTNFLVKPPHWKVILVFIMNQNYLIAFWALAMIT